MERKFCQRCGSEVSPGARFCPECGAVVRTVQPAAPDVEYATWAERAVAVLVDYVIVFVIGFAPYGVLMSIAAAGGSAVFAGMPVVTLWLLGVALLYEPLMLGRYGETIGKRIFKIRVVDERLQPVSYSTAFVRTYVGKMLVGWLLGMAAMGVLALLNVLWPLWDSRSQALHDKVARTLVVKARSLPVPEGARPEPGAGGVAEESGEVRGP